ncbi:MAG: Asp-tRNA(Asn)/Glu-tRNA(Gln) amidotransferase subunit GatA [Syntrophomonadaceae bacterium]|nr:Asp-tRNA(Asn)/Glu-tRNA(Gln) amidotransferase subunit GatA [Syntrophomonadaceae bacterium]
MQLCDLTIHQLKSLLEKKEATAEEILDSCLVRIQAVEPKVRAFITVLEDSAREIARAIDKQGNYQGLAGIPYGLKDVFCTRGVKTTCASRMLENFVPNYDATAVSRLIEAGAVMVGKLNMDEFAMGSSTEHSAFFPTHNPWDYNRVPGGSSGGSAAAVAAGEIPFSLGSDTGGSVRQPAAYCGVVGIKPTYGRISRWGVIAYASSLDQVGVLTRDVADCALVLKTISGYDPLDSTSINIEVPNYPDSLQDDIRGLKIAYPREYFQQGVDEQVKAAVMQALKTYESLGAVVDEVSLPHSEYALPAYYLVANAEASANLAKYDGVRYGLRDFSAENVVDMFSQSRAQGFGPEVKRRIMLGTYALSAGYYEAYYLKALKVRRLLKNDFDQVFENFDVIAAPTTPTVAFKIGEQVGDPLTLYMNDILTVPVNMAGLPGMSIPCGFADGMPIGLQLIGKPFAESTIIKAAYAFEQATSFHLAKPALGVK